MSYIVYCYTNKYNGKKYIGITSRSMAEREESHIYEAKNKTNKCYNAPFKRAIRKYGMNAFNNEILDIVDTHEEACNLEKYYIEKFKTYYKYCNSNGYNATTGGEMLIAPKDRVVQISFDLDILKIWDSVAIAERELKVGIYDVVNKVDRIANNSYWFYEKYFNEIKETYKEQIMLANNYICQASLDRKLIKIWYSASVAANSLKISQGNISSCCIGLRKTTNNSYWCYYKDFVKGDYPKYVCKTDRLKAVLQFSLNGVLIQEYSSLTEASINTGINITSICSSAARGNAAGGFLWRYKDKYRHEKVVYINNNKTKVDKYDENHNYIYSYDSLQEAAKSVGIKYTGISRAIKHGCKAGGHYWKKPA